MHIGICMYVCMYIYIYICIYVYVYMYMYIYLYLYGGSPAHVGARALRGGAAIWRRASAPRQDSASSCTPAQQKDLLKEESSKEACKRRHLSSRVITQTGLSGFLHTCSAKDSVKKKRQKEAGGGMRRVERVQSTYIYQYLNVVWRRHLWL